jgi:thymidylate synthase
MKKMMIKADKYYKENLQKILDEGCVDINPRPRYKDNTPAHSKFITQVFEEYNLSKNEFPLTTLRNTAIKTGINEICWIYQKESNSLSVANEMGINWWGKWDIGNGTIGKRYGATINQWGLMKKLLYSLKNDPYSRRHIINMYQESDLSETNGLFPCAYETIWSVRCVNNINYLDMTLIQRSNDYIMAGYINKIQYVALQMMVAKHLDYEIGKFCHLVQNLHIYDRHYDAANVIINRVPIEVQPYITLEEKKDFYDYTVDDFKIFNIENISKLNIQLELAI